MCGQARSGNILQHLAAELRRAEAAGGMERLMNSGGNLPRGATYPAAGHGVRRRQSDPDFLAQIAGGQPQPQSRRVLFHNPFWQKPLEVSHGSPPPNSFNLSGSQSVCPIFILCATCSNSGARVNLLRVISELVRGAT